MRTEITYDGLIHHNRGKLTPMLFCSQNRSMRMRTETKIHFGLTFPPAFPLDDKSCRQLAKILLLNPRISIRRAKEIINNKELWRKVSLLSNKLHCEISGISILESETKEKDFQEQFISFLLELLYELFQVVYPDHDIAFRSFQHKLFSWITEFSFPLPNELKVIANTIEIPEENVHDSVYAMLFHRDMPPIKIFDYLMKYQYLLSASQIDDLLDLYSEKTKSKHVAYIQLDMFSDNNNI